MKTMMVKYLVQMDFKIAVGHKRKKHSAGEAVTRKVSELYSANVAERVCK